MKKTVCHIVFLFFLVLTIDGNNIYFSKIDIENGLSQSSVNSIYQDEFGSMWFGTREGLNRYSGSGVEVFLPVPNDSNSLSHHIISTICGNKNGLLFIQTYHGVVEFNLRTNSLRCIQNKKIDAMTFGANKLWIADDKTIYTYDGEKKSIYFRFSESISEIKTITLTSDLKLIIGTISSGLFVIDKNQKCKQLLSDCSQIASVFEDSRKILWIATWENGLYRIDKNGNINNFRHDNNEQISSNFVRAICEDNEGNIWIGTKKGLDVFDIDADSFILHDDGYNSSQLSNESIWYLYKDVQGTIWVGTYFGGVNYFNPDIFFYTFHNLRKGSFRYKPFPVISHIIEDESHNLFLCTEGDGLVHYNPQDQSYKIYNNSSNLITDNIKCACYDKTANTLWLGIHLGGLCKFNGKTKTFKSIKTHPEWRQSNIVRTIIPYQNNFLAGTYNGLFLLDKQTETLSLFSEKLHEKIQIYIDAKIDDKNNLWIGGYGLHCYNFDTGEISSYFYDEHDMSSLSSNNVEKILIDSKKRIWIATNGRGLNLFQPESNSFKRYNSQNSALKNDFISNLIESNYGYILITTTQSLSILDPEKEKITNYDTESGFPLNSLFNGGICYTQKGELYVAGMNNMISFFEENLNMPQPPFNIWLINLWVNNELIKPYDDSKILKQSLPYTKSITLNHKQSSLQFEFGSSNYCSATLPKYRYILKSSSNGNWTDLTHGNRNLNFVNLSPGKYNLIVEAVSYIDGAIIAKTELEIIMKSPIYLTWYAFAFYALIVALIIWRYMAFSRSKLLLKTSLDYEKKEKEQQEEVNQSKLRFFTNISHEFRTPLTLISGQIDMLLQTHNIPPAIYNRILNVKRQTLNMQGLINELLEFRKSEQGHLKIHAVELDLVKFLYEIYISFSEYAKYRHIKLKFNCKEEKIMIWIDPKEIQKVFYNLISNAFKYTPKEGIISIVVEEFTDKVSISIIDSGVGIPSESINKIFDRFYHAENSIQINNMVPGTGIGLALTKNILETHQAEIFVESQTEIGSKFIVILKKGSSHFTKEQKSSESSIDMNWMNNLTKIDTEFTQEIIKAQVVGNSPHYSMLIVEDNEDLCNMLVQVFSPIYKVFTASNGEEGLKQAVEKQPDIILSDLMMPKMSGNEMCFKIKNNSNICHIPVVLITAQTAIEYKIEGLGLGADDYITKPFDIKTLILRCNNLVNNRRIMQEKFGKQADFSPRMVATNEMDRMFLEKAYEIVENNLDNPDLDVAFLSNELAMGRTSLFNKMKGVTGQTPNEFVITVKLKKATVLLREHPEYNVSDITYMLGFNTPKYFAKCFKEHYGISPTGYRKQKQVLKQKS